VINDSAIDGVKLSKLGWEITCVCVVCVCVCVCVRERERERETDYSATQAWHEEQLNLPVARGEGKYILEHLVYEPLCVGLVAWKNGSLQLIISCIMAREWEGI